jgi:hypothetical protein
VLEVGVVVDLHDDEAVVGLLDVDAVEPLPDRPGPASLCTRVSALRVAIVVAGHHEFAEWSVDFPT